MVGVAAAVAAAVVGRRRRSCGTRMTWGQDKRAVLRVRWPSNRRFGGVGARACGWREKGDGRGRGNGLERCVWVKCVQRQDWKGVNIHHHCRSKNLPFQRGHIFHRVSAPRTSSLPCGSWSTPASDASSCPRRGRLPSSWSFVVECCDAVRLRLRIALLAVARCRGEGEGEAMGE